MQSLQVKYWNHLTNLVIVRAPRDDYRLVSTAVSYVTLIKQRPCTFAPLHIGGTIRSCQKAAISYTRNILTQLYLEKLQDQRKPIMSVASLLPTKPSPSSSPLPISLE